MKNLNMIRGAALAALLVSGSSFAQNSCTDWENEYGHESSLQLQRYVSEGELDDIESLFPKKLKSLLNTSLMS